MITIIMNLTITIISAIIIMIIKEIKLTTTTNIHNVKIQPCFIYSFLNEGTYVVNSFEKWLQSIAPLNLKLLFRNALFGSCQFSILI